MVSIYLASSPYHVLIATAMAQSIDESDVKTLLIIKDFKDSLFLKNSIEAWDKNPFSNIILIEGVFDGKDEITSIKSSLINYFIKRIKQSFLVRRGIKDIRILTRQSNHSFGNRLFVFSDTHPIGQYAVLLNAKRGGINIYVEDGAVAYSNTLLPTIPFLQMIFAKIIYGPWYRNIKIIGTNPHIQEVFVFFPQLVRDEIKFLNLRTLPKDLFNNLESGLILNFNDIYDRFFDNFFPDCILLLPLSKYGELTFPSFIDKYEKIAQIIAKSCRRVYFKLHPRETKGDYLSLKNKYGFHEIPQSLPAELLFLATLENPPDFIVGDISTAIISSRIIYGKKSRSISVINILSENNDLSNLPTFFKKIEISIPNSLQELEFILMTC